MIIAIGSDHGGFAQKECVKKLLEAKGVEVIDYGCYSTESCDYPIYAEKVAVAVETDKADRGVLVCTSGVGMTIAANRFPHVRAALCVDADIAKNLFFSYILL